MRGRLCRWVIAALILLVSNTAAADNGGGATSESSDWLALGVGARVGGYGFRDVTDDGHLRWDDCRMNGVGVFGTVDFGKYLFGEISADYYHAIGEVIAAGMDWQSLFMLGAAGVRLFPDVIISPFIEAGGGAEWTKITVGGGSDVRVLPTGFMGVGGEFDVWDIGLGTQLRVFAMGEPVHGDAPGGHARASHMNLDGTTAIDIEYQVAGELQFYVRRTF